VWLYFLVFCTASVLFALGMARWFRFLRDEDELERRHARDWHG
jgi:membrane protein implicated in regulation of membrane protease activity